MQLAIDTSTDMASIALVQESEVLAELTWLCGQNHSAELLPMLTHLIRQTRLGLEFISGIIVAVIALIILMWVTIRRPET